MIPKTRRQLTSEVEELRDRVTGLETCLAELLTEGRIVINLPAPSRRAQEVHAAEVHRRNRELGPI